MTTTATVKKRRSLPALLVSGVVGLSIVAGGAYAALTSEAFNSTPQRVDSGTLTLRLSSGAFTGVIGNMAPLDARYQMVDLVNDGTLEGRNVTLSATDASPTVLTTDGVKGLQARVDACSVAWAADGTCSGTATPLMNTVSLNALGSTAQPIAAVMPAGSTLRLKVTTSLPDVAETTTNGVKPAGSIQGLTANLTWKFTETQRPGTTTAVS